MKNFLLYFLLTIPMSLLVACGDSDEAPGNSTSDTQAWLCSFTRDGTDVDLIITFDEPHQGVYRSIVNSVMSRHDIYYERDGQTYDCRIENASATDFIFNIDGLSAVGYDGISYYNFSPVNLDTYYRDWYERLARSVKTFLESYSAGGSYSQYDLAVAKNMQKTMANVRCYAALDGITIEQSEWETKSSDEYNSSLYPEWQNKYDAQVEVVKGLYYEYRACTDRFSQTAIKSSYESAQYHLIRIRAQAEDNDVFLTPSEWETKSITS